jgi:hypothetical protein
VLAINKALKSIPEDLNYQVYKSAWVVLEKARFTCSCCHFSSAPSKEVLSGYMEVLKGTVLCSICSSSLQLNRTVRNLQNHGHIIMANDLTQGQVSQLTREIAFKLLSKDSRKVTQAKLVQESLLSSEITHKQYPFLTKDHPQTCTELANCFEVIDEIEEAHYKAIFQDLRYVPSFAAYSHIYDYWNSIHLT